MSSRNALSWQIKDVVEAAHRRIQIDVRKWAVRKYGDHIALDLMARPGAA
jgi:hypothetical protein